MSRPEYLNVPMTPEIIRHIRGEQERYDEDPGRYEEMERQEREYQAMEEEKLEREYLEYQQEYDARHGVYYIEEIDEFGSTNIPVDPSNFKNDNDLPF
jgi:hypothetical protein